MRSPVAEGLAGDQLVAADDCLAAAEIDDDVAVFDTLDLPLTISPIRSLNSSYCRSRSASRTFCTMTCLADCAAMRPKSIGGSNSAMKSPTCAAGLRLRASSSRDLVGRVLDRLDDLHQPLQLHLAGFRVDVGADIGLRAIACAGRLLDRVLHRVMTIMRSIAFSRATASAICRSSSRFALTAMFVSPINPMRLVSAFVEHHLLRIGPILGFGSRSRPRRRAPRMGE